MAWTVKHLYIFVYAYTQVHKYMFMKLVIPFNIALELLYYILHLFFWNNSLPVGNLSATKY